MQVIRITIRFVLPHFAFYCFTFVELAHFIICKRRSACICIGTRILNPPLYSSVSTWPLYNVPHSTLAHLGQEIGYLELCSSFAFLLRYILHQSEFQLIYLGRFCDLMCYLDH